MTIYPDPKVHVALASGSVDWNIIPYIKRVWVGSLVREHTQVLGTIQIGECMRGNLLISLSQKSINAFSSED